MWRYNSRMPNNIVNCLNERLLASNDEYRDQLSCRIYHQVVLQSSFVFKRVWTKLSKQSVCIGLDSDGSNGMPHLLYNLPPTDKSKIWAAILYHCQIRQVSPSPEEQNVCLITLTSDGYLKVLNADTGEIIRIIYLSTDIVFRYLHWADYLDTIQIKSVKAIRQTASVQQMLNDNGSRGRILSLMVLKIHPLKLITYFHIEKCIFGDNVRDAAITEDLLMIFTSSNTCEYYNLHWIIKHFTKHNINLNESVKIGDSSWFHPGVYPNSIPVTLQITETPPILFTTKCVPEFGVSFGGSPLVYIHHGYTTNVNEFHIRELRTKKLVKKLTTEFAAFHHDVAEFHFDDYRRILHISGCTVSCYQLCQVQGLRLIYFIDFKKMFQPDIDMPQVSTRGRTIKPIQIPPYCFDDFSSAVQDLDYENEVHLLYAVITLPEGEGTKALVCFINEAKGTIDKIVPLPTWDPSAGNSIYYELDCIIHLVQKNSQNICHFYRLTRE